MVGAGQVLLSFLDLKRIGVVALHAAKTCHFGSDSLASAIAAGIYES